METLRQRGRRGLALVCAAAGSMLLALAGLVALGGVAGGEQVTAHEAEMEGI